MNNFMPPFCEFEKTYSYTLNEVLTKVNYANYFSSTAGFDAFLTAIGYDATNLKASFVGSSDDKTLAYQIFNNVHERYGSEYMCRLNDELTNADAEAYLLKIIRILNWTFPKYSKILALYEANKNKMLDGIKRVEQEISQTTQTSETTGDSTDNRLSKFNDTPQQPDGASGTFDGDGYISELTKDTASGTSHNVSGITGSAGVDRTHTDERDTLIERLTDLENKWSLVMKRWMNEFEPLFLSEENF